ncbi:MAG: GNAT family N-acetyltransferase [Clostridia bacterium]|nr:GNAT family N-acetyltransferase [Clostridia bacterium]
MYRGKFMITGADINELLSVRMAIPEFQGAGLDDNDNMAVFALIYDEEDTPCGCGRMYIGSDSRFTIDLLGVLPSHRGRYVGDLLARMLLYKAQELNAGSVRALVPGDTALFFSRYGFRPLGEKEMLFGKEAYLMQVDGDKISLEGKCSCGKGKCDGECAICK